MTHSLWHWITPFGNSAILLPVAGAIAVWLLARPEMRRTGGWWCAALAVECAFVGGTKVAYMAWGWAPTGLNFIGLSGDSAMAFVFWPAAAAGLVPHRVPGWRAAAIGLAGVLAVLVAISRVETFAHSVSEAVGGAVFGALVVGTFLAATWREPPPLTGRAAWVPVVVLVAALLLTAAQPRPIDYNSIFADTARFITGHRTIYTRCDLGPWAALQPSGRSCIPRGPGAAGQGLAPRSG